MGTIHDSLVFLCFLVVVLHVWITLEVFCSLAHDILYPWRKHRILIAHGNEEEDAWSQDILEVVGNEGSHQLVLLLGELHRLSIQLGSHRLHIASIHDGLVVLMHQFPLLALQLLVFLEESEELIVEWRSTYYLLYIVEFHGNASRLQHQRQNRLIVHEYICHSCRIYRSLEMELSMYHITGVDLAEFVVL